MTSYIVILAACLFVAGCYAKKPTPAPTPGFAAGLIQYENPE